MIPDPETCADPPVAPNRQEAQVFKTIQESLGDFVRPGGLGASAWKFRVRANLKFSAASRPGAAMNDSLAFPDISAVNLIVAITFTVYNWGYELENPDFWEFS